MTIAGPARPGLAWPAGCCCGRPLFYDRFVMMKFKRHFLFFFSHLDVKSWTLGVCRNERPRLLSTFPPSFYYYDFDSALFFFIPAGRPLLHSINRRAPFDDKTLGLQVAHFDFDFKRRNLLKKF
jgi:hypothetical protein